MGTPSKGILYGLQKLLIEGAARLHVRSFDHSSHVHRWWSGGLRTGESIEGL